AGARARQQLPAGRAAGGGRRQRPRARPRRPRPARADRMIGEAAAEAPVRVGGDDDVVIEEGVPLARSLLWQLQRAYYEGQGIAAWSAGQVPQYVTTNPFIADAYA